MRIAETCFGWLDLDHIQSVSPLEWEPNLRGWGGSWTFHVHLIMRDEPRSLYGEWSKEKTERDTLMMERHSYLIAQWKGNQNGQNCNCNRR